MNANIPIQTFSCPSIQVIRDTTPPDPSYFKNIYQIAAKSDQLLGKKMVIASVLELPVKTSAIDQDFIDKHCSGFKKNTDPSNSEINNFLRSHTLHDFKPTFFNINTELEFHINQLTKLLDTQKKDLENLKNEVSDFIAEKIKNASCTEEQKQDHIENIKKNLNSIYLHDNVDYSELSHDCFSRIVAAFSTSFKYEKKRKDHE